VLKVSPKKSDDLQADLEHFQHDVDYYYAHFDELLAQHPDEWVVIYNKEVVGTGTVLEDLLDSLRERGVPPELSVVKYPAAVRETWILYR
jgi:hypothetical protein